VAKTNGSKRGSGKGARVDKVLTRKRVNLLGTVQLLEKYITPALCGAAFRKLRTRERQREWPLHALVEFWIAVVLRAPASLTQTLNAVRDGSEPMVPRVQATPEAFFERCRNLSCKFFAEVFRNGMAVSRSTRATLRPFSP
jgi:hypothetical protein